MTGANGVLTTRAAAATLHRTYVPNNGLAIGIFIAFVALTIGITIWASRRKSSLGFFYTAGGGITALQNGLAIAGDYMSASSFLGVSSLIYTFGYDGLLYVVGTIAGWPIVMFLLAERLRNLGRYNAADVVSYRLGRAPTRVVSAIGSLVVVSIYLVGQMVGAGQLITLLFGLKYQVAVVLMGVLMTTYVIFGGMLATTWVQIIKAVLLLAGVTYIGLAVLFHFGFDVHALLQSAVNAHPRHMEILRPGLLLKDPIATLSLSMALIFGTAGLPHVMMRFFTVADAREARTSVFYASCVMSYFYVILLVIGFGAIALVASNPQYLGPGGALRGGGNMAAVLLAHAVGGDVVMGFISAVTFATILAVVSGLTLSGATTVAHDLYANVFRYKRHSERQELVVSKVSTVVIALVAVGLGVGAQNQNIAFLGSLAFAVAASVNFPPLLLSLYWRGLTTLGVVLGASAGLISSIGLTIISPVIWQHGFGFAKAIFPYESPTIVSMPLAFFVTWLVSTLDRSPQALGDRMRFNEQFVRSETGLGAIGLEKSA